MDQIGGMALSLIYQAYFSILFYLELLMSLEADFFFSEVLYFDEIPEPDHRIPHSLHYENRNQSMQTIHLTDGTQKKSEDEKSSQKNLLDYSNVLSETAKNVGQSRYIPPKPKQYKSLLPEVMNKKIKSSKTEITVFFFETKKRIIFTKNQINKAFLVNSQFKNQGNVPINTGNKLFLTLKMLIPYMVKCYCKLFLNFEPLEVDYETFELKLANLDGLQDPILDPIDYNEQIVWLYEGNNYVLVRKHRNREKIMEWQHSLTRMGNNDMQALQIITPMKRKQIVQQFERNKTVNALKEKMISYNQMGNIVIIAYSSFKICEPKKKISEIVNLDRVLEVYREKTTTFIDIEMYKKNVSEDNKLQREDYAQKITFHENYFQVSSSSIYGSLSLKIDQTKLIEIYDGGLVNSILNRNQNRKQRSFYALFGIAVNRDKIKMKFMNKTGEETVNYQFNSKIFLQKFIKTILKIGRQLKLNYERI